MKLNHLDLQVPDVQSTASFFVTHFDFTHQSNRKSPAIAILSGSDGFTLVLQRNEDDEPYPDGFHLGFLVDDDAAVEAAHARLKAANVSCSEPIRNGRGLAIYVAAPGDLLVEVSHPKKK